MRNTMLKYDDAQNLHRDEMMRVFRDVDGLKKQLQAAEREQLKIQRDIVVIFLIYFVTKIKSGRANMAKIRRHSFVAKSRNKSCQRCNKSPFLIF